MTVKLLLIAEIEIPSAHEMGVDPHDYNVERTAQHVLDTFRESALPSDRGISLYRAAREINRDEYL